MDTVYEEDLMLVETSNGYLLCPGHALLWVLPTRPVGPDDIDPELPYRCADCDDPTWDEPETAATPRGWLKVGGTCVGFYLDYGPDHYRSPHAYCRPSALCPTCQPGTILAVRYPNGPGTRSESRWCETAHAARLYVTAGAA